MQIYKDIIYGIEDVKEESVIVENKFTQVLNLNRDDVLKFVYKGNSYYIFNPYRDNLTTSFSFMLDKNLVSVNLGDKLKIIINGNVQEEIFAPNIEYQGCETIQDLAILYFTGERKFVLIIKKDKLQQAMFYDEYNKKEQERWFLCRLNDGLNHGKVVHISGQNVDNYLVYLDENNLNLQDKFVANIFLDCVASGNFKYCNSLLCEELKQEKEDKIKSFFNEFDWFCCVEENVFALIKKNTLAGIYKFEINNLQVQNIIML